MSFNSNAVTNNQNIYNLNSYVIIEIIQIKFRFNVFTLKIIMFSIQGYENILHRNSKFHLVLQHVNRSRRKTINDLTNIASG